MSRKVFVQVPSNEPSGGIKVANQLVNLFREHDYESYIVLPQEIYQADWLIHPAPTINIARMKELCENDDLVIDNWIDKNTMNETRRLKAKMKIFYSQGCTFYKSNSLIGDEHLRKDLGYTHFWTVSQDSLTYLSKKYPRIKKWYLVNPYLDIESIKKITKGIKRENKILAFSRKGPFYIKVARLCYENKIKFTIVNKFTEEEGYKLMASHKFFLSTAMGVGRQHLWNILRIFKYGNAKHNFSVILPNGPKEGFPLPPAEAAMCGCIVIGFAMGGGLEWMSPDTCFLAKDRSLFSLLSQIKKALTASPKKLARIQKNAFSAIRQFNKINTWNQIRTFLSEV